MAGQSSGSEKAYVTDTLRITLRTGPSIENKIVTFLNSGDSLEVMETQGDWSRVRVLGNDKIKNEGWVLKQYLIYHTPYKSQAETLMYENKELKEKLTPLSENMNKIQKQREELSILYQRSQKELGKLKEDYDSLKEDSSEYLKLKAELTATQSKLRSTETKAENLYIENITLKKSQRNIWFAIGALVLLFGLLIGFIFGRQSKKKKSLYY
jgi:SH3 domain protein